MQHKDRSFFIRVLFPLLAGLLFSNANYAGLVLSGTRLIYPASDREITLKVENKSNLPLLAQSWIDTGNERIAPENSDAPFTITPPISRIDPTKAQTLRIFMTPEKKLPNDRENVFWLNVLEIPPKAKGGNFVSVAYRNRIKVFYRPTLPMTSSDSLEKVEWRLRNNQLIGKNLSPYYLNYSTLTINNSGNAILAKSPGGMISPFSEQVFEIKNRANIAQASKIVATAINDFGGLVDKQFPITR